MCKFLHYIDKFTLKTLYLIYLRPTIEYCSVLRASHSKSEIDDLHSLYKTKLSHTIILCLKASKIGVFFIETLLGIFCIINNFMRLNTINLFNVNMRINHRSYQLLLYTPIARTSVFKYALP